MKLVEMLNPFKGKEAGDAPDQHHEVGTQHDPVFDEVLWRYLARKDARYPDFMHHMRTTKQLRKDKVYEGMPILNPSQINCVLPRVAAICLSPFVAAELLSYLIQDSYDAGHNDFVIVLPRHIDFYVASGLEGMPENPLHATLHGDLGDFACYGSKHCQFDIMGKFGAGFAENARQCVFRAPDKETYDELLLWVQPDNKRELMPEVKP